MTIKRASPETFACSGVTARGITHFTARKFAGDQYGSLISVILGKPNVGSTVLELPFFASLQPKIIITPKPVLNKA
jgi:hypothetical protein